MNNTYIQELEDGFTTLNMRVNDEVKLIGWRRCTDGEPAVQFAFRVNLKNRGIINQHDVAVLVNEAVEATGAKSYFEMSQVERDGAEGDDIMYNFLIGNICYLTVG